jgi:PAS domain S-box-containing protein
MTEMLGYGADELIGRSLFEFMDDEWRARAHAHFERRRAGYSDRHEFKFRRRDGSALWAWVSTNAVFGGDGRFAGALAMITDLTARKLVEDTQAFLLSCGLPGSGEDFFQSLARYIAQVLGMEYVCIDRLEGNGRLATTVAVYNDGEFESNVTYALKDTPCGAVLDQSVCCFPRDVQRLFGKDAVLRELEAESYIGTVLWDSKGQPIGLIAVIGRLPMTKPQEGEALLALVAPRAAGELERREAERSLRESEERMRLALQATHDVIWDWDPVNDAQHWSSAGSRIFGWSEIVERPQSAAWWVERVHPLDRERVADGFHAAVGNPAATHWEDEYRFECSDGHYALVYDRGYVLRDEAGRAVRMIGAMQDITARKEVEEELQAYRHHLEDLVQQRTAELSASEAKALQILHSSADGLYGIDREGNTIFINSAACELLGYTPEQILGRPLHALIHHRHPDGTPYPAADCPTLQCLRTGQRSRIDREVYWHADGHPIPVMYGNPTR